MPDSIPQDSVGIVETQILHFTEALQLECGKTLDEYDIAYETYGLGGKRVQVDRARKLEQLMAEQGARGHRD